MQIIHDHGKILQMVWDKDISFIEPHSFDILQVDESDVNIPLLKKIFYSVAIQEISDYRVNNGQIDYFGQSFVFSIDADRAQFFQDFQNAVDQLQIIQDLVNPTNTQIVNAVKLLAKVLRLLLLMIKKYVLK